MWWIILINFFGFNAWERFLHFLVFEQTKLCDPSKVRFGLLRKIPTIQFYIIKNNFKSNHLIELKLYQKIPDVFFYLGLNFQVNQSSGRTCNIGQNRLYESGCTNFVIYFLLSCRLPIWQRSFFYNNVAACFGNLLVLQGSLMGCNIVYKNGKDSLMFHNPFLTRISYSS